MKPQVLFLKASINFEDTKIWNILEWNFLFIIKENSFSIHNMSQSTCIFNCKYTKIIREHSLIKVYYQTTFLTINIKETLNFIDLSWLSFSWIQKEKEENLKKELIEKLKKEENIKILWEEYQTNYWNIDIFYFNETSKEYIVLELKNRSLKEWDIKQCERYLEYFEEIFSEDKNIKWIVIWTEVSNKIKGYSNKKNIESLTYSNFKI